MMQVQKQALGFPALSQWFPSGRIAEDFLEDPRIFYYGVLIQP